jgi:hypothetical protein
MSQFLKYLTCLWIGRINIVKVASYWKTCIDSIQSPIIIKMAFLTELEKSAKIHIETQKTLDS